MEKTTEGKWVLYGLVAWFALRAMWLTVATVFVVGVALFAVDIIRDGITDAFWEILVSCLFIAVILVFLGWRWRCWWRKLKREWKSVRAESIGA